MEIYIPILLFALAYVLDMSTCLLVRKFNPKYFNANEDNLRFKTFIESKGLAKGIILYSLTYGLQYVIMFFIATCFTYALINGRFSFSGTTILAFTFLSFFHFVAMVTNLIALKKKEKINKPIEKSIIQKEVNSV